MNKLFEVQSVHEQREGMGDDTKIEKGVWIEISDFDDETEQVKIHKRFEVLDVKKEDKDNRIHYVITCKKRNIEEDDKIREDLANKVIDRHKLILKASFVKCLVEGIDMKSVGELKKMLYRLGGEVNDKQKNS